MASTICVITVNGQDISSTVLPRLLNLSVVDKAGGSSDTCTISLDDTDGSIIMPSKGAELVVELGDESGIDVVFKGTVDEPRTSGSRSGGRTISISAKGVDTKGKAKEPQSKHWDDKSLGDVLKDAGKVAGLDLVTVAPALASITRKYWAMQNESFLHFGERLAREVGGTFKVVGSQAILADRNGGTSASGAALPSVNATWGDNLISWDIAPSLGRPRFKEIKVRHYDTKTGTTKEETVQIEDDEATATHVDRHTAADEDEAKARAESIKKDSERAKGGGTITIDGSTKPQPEGSVVLSGARPGADGSYTIDTVTQDVSRGSGWTTKLDVKKPSGDAGKDSRGASNGTAASPPVAEAGAVPASNIG